MTKQRKADLLLVLVTMFWGVSYYFIDLCLTDLSPFNLNAFRFLSAFILLGAVFIKKLVKVNLITLKYGVLIGLCLVFSYIGATFGVKNTSVSNAGFICSLAVVTAPLFSLLLYKKKPGAKLIIALVICTVGLGLLTLNGFSVAKGDIICLLTAVFYGLDIVITEDAVSHSEVEPIALGVCEIGVCGTVMLVLSFIFEQPHLPTKPDIWLYALFLGIFCSGIAFVIQSVQQQYTTAAHVGLIFTLEPVFSAFVAYFFAKERLSVQGYIGAGLMLSSLILTEIKIERK